MHYTPFMSEAKAKAVLLAMGALSAVVYLSDVSLTPENPRMPQQDKVIYEPIKFSPTNCLQRTQRDIVYSQQLDTFFTQLHQRSYDQATTTFNTLLEQARGHRDRDLVRRLQNYTFIVEKRYAPFHSQYGHFRPGGYKTYEFRPSTDTRTPTSIFRRDPR